MRTLPLAMLMLGIAAAYGIVRATTDFGDVYPLPGFALFLTVLGLLGLLLDVYGRLDRRLNKRPPVPYFEISKVHGRVLELASDGTYESCQRFLATLSQEFEATYAVHLDAGPRPSHDKEHGYWKVRMFGQDFFVMRVRGDGMCIWGPKAPADVSGFLRVATYFNAVEFRTWQTKLVRSVCGRTNSK